MTGFKIQKRPKPASGVAGRQLIAYVCMSVSSLEDVRFMSLKTRKSKCFDGSDLFYCVGVGMVR
jgi:hypothetical protein